MKKQLLIYVSAAVVLFGLTSCFQVESNISVKKDGSGTITEEMILGDQMKMMIEMAAAQGGQAGPNPMAQMLDKTKAEARAGKMGKGVELVSVEKIDADGKLGVRTTYKFADINQLKYAINDATDMGEIPGAAAKKIEQAGDAGIKFVLAEGKLTMIQKTPKPDQGDKAPVEENKPEAQEAAGMDPQAMAMMQEIMKDMRVTLKVTIEPGIAKTDATHVEGKVITLSDIQMGKIISNPEKIKALQGGDFDSVKQALKGIDGIKFEDKEQVTVEMK